MVGYQFIRYNWTKTLTNLATVTVVRDNHAINDYLDRGVPKRAFPHRWMEKLEEQLVLL